MTNETARVILEVMPIVWSVLALLVWSFIFGRTVSGFLRAYRGR